MAETLNLEKLYKDSIAKDLSGEMGGINLYAVPRLNKVVLNVGVGKIVSIRKGGTTEQKKEVELVADLVEGLAQIGGQHPQFIKSKKSISGFKLREGAVVGLRSTLRGKKMYDFVARLIHIGLPRTRDFRGVSAGSVDQHGNLTIGIREASIFPELTPSNFNWGFEATLVTSAKNRDEALELFKKIGIPFSKAGQK
ncbi:MAG: 50S ribosomal protein L5 [Candidatus Spechtbacteria bacterium RIFCSPLOWO2_01_FULL_43_12]|uniref:Large ribosomal subunit protein uL5 n=1 Tax=Candidatus Spechtbacteria bacterium RIFCSPLOWO2_01_FULL_43_12 TaxID=1802162 RepID=A0A1G2HDN1_9BACT|nr:MAG: 50S ribosomal protein L5 [Candidatus Spechtbacteria bacterium RIFCSPLOWO2_01_FULL_43_12]